MLQMRLLNTRSHKLQNSMQEPIDKIWFDKLSAIHAFSLEGKMAGDPRKRRAQKRLFLANEIDAPTLSYPRLEVFNIDRKRRKLEALKIEIELKEESPITKKAYELYLDEKLGHLDILEAIKDGDDDRFAKLISQTFEPPSQEILNRLVPHIQDLVSQATASGNQLSSNAAKFISELVSDIPASSDPVLQQFFSEPESTIDSEGIVTCFQSELADRNIPDWSSEIDHDVRNSSIIIDQRTKRIIVPRHRIVSKTRLEALVKHEIGVHVVRRVNADQSRFLLLSIGLDHYLKGEEGLAKSEEHSISPSAMNSSVELYLGISLAMGLTGSSWNFRELFTFFQNYYLASRFSKQDLSISIAQNYAWNRTVRLFRGTTGKSRGVCFTKELAYLHGYLEIQSICKTDPDEVKRFFYGKYDPSNSFHRELLDTVID